MKYASEKLRPYLNEINWKQPKFPIISNVTSKIVRNKKIVNIKKMNKEEIPKLLESKNQVECLIV